MCAKYYENPTMLSKVTAENVGDVFETLCRSLRIKCRWFVGPTDVRYRATTEQLKLVL